MTDACERVIKVLQEGFDVIDIVPETILGRFNMDSLDIVELVMDLEEEFDMEIPDATWESFGLSIDHTVQQLTNCVEGWCDGRLIKLKSVSHLPWQEVGF